MPKKIIVRLQCSNCGAVEEIKNRIDETEKAIKSGWGSYGSALYCPKCSETWDERNPGRPMADERHTFWIIAALIHRALGGNNYA